MSADSALMLPEDAIENALCSRCSTISVPDDSREWTLDHGIVQDILLTAEQGCSFCSLLNTTLGLRQVATKDAKNAYLSVYLNRPAESDEISISLAIVDARTEISSMPDGAGSLVFSATLWAFISWEQNRQEEFHDPRYHRQPPDQSPWRETVTTSCLMGTVNHWVAECGTTHQCIVSDEPSKLPTRIIDVGLSNQEELRLVIREESELTRAHYAALSYCWGQSNTFTTSSATLNERKAGFCLSSLPLTIRDAVRITRWLGLRYLWVDALCIIQGADAEARQDWELEVSHMVDVYKNAFVTISAATAPHADAGLFYRKECILPLNWQETSESFVDSDLTSDGATGNLSTQQKVSCTEYRGGLPPGTPSHTTLVSSYDQFTKLSKEGFDSQPLHHRAWALQEHLMSPRLLMFTSFGVVWQCNEGPRGKNTPRSRLSPSTYVQRLYDYRLPKSPTQPIDWATVVESYSRRSLTNPDDKFHAVSALARRHHAATGDRYYAGLWESSFLHELVWYRDRNWLESHQPDAEKPSKGRRAPSWSWASIDGCVHSGLSSRFDTADLVAEVISCHVDLANPNNPFGAPTAATLTLRGPVQQVTGVWLRSGDPDDSHAQAYMCLWEHDSDEEHPAGELLLDCPIEESMFDAPVYKDMCCIWIFKDEYFCRAIALMPVVGAPNTFTRVGLILADSRELANRLKADWSEAGVTTTMVII